MPETTTRPVTPQPGLKTPQVQNPVAVDARVAPWAYYTVAFGPPPNPFQSRAAVHHAVHWNKVREMLRPYGWEEVPDSATILGGGDGSIITFRTRGAPVLPEPVQEWLKSAEPKGWEIATKIAKGAAAVLSVIASAFGVPRLGMIASGATVVLSAVEEHIVRSEKEES